MALNLSNVSTLATAKPKPKGKAKAEREMPGVERFAMVSALFKALEAVKDTFAGAIKAEAVNYFREQIAESGGRKPDSFKATEGTAHASVEFRKRGSQFGLNDGQVQALRAAGIEPAREVIVPELFALNPSYTTAQIEELLKSVDLPADFIVKQAEQVKYTVSDDTLAAALKTGNHDAIDICTTLALKPALREVNMSRIFDLVRELLNPTPNAPAANEGAKQDKAAA